MAGRSELYCQHQQEIDGAVIPLWVLLSRVIMVHPHLNEILAKLRAYLEEEYGDRLVQVLLFGSQARGDAEPDSDIDVMVILSDVVDACREINHTSNFLSVLCLDYDVLVSCIFTSEAQFQSKKDTYFFRNVHQQGVPV